MKGEKYMKHELLWIILSILSIVGIIGLNIYKLINNSINTLDLIMDVLMLIVLINNILSFFKKKDK